MTYQIVVYCDKCKAQTEYTRESDTYGYGGKGERTYSVTLQYKCPACGRELQRSEDRTDKLVNGKWHRTNWIDVRQSSYSLDGFDMNKLNVDKVIMARQLRGLAIWELSRDCGVHLRDIKALEERRALVGTDALKRIAKTLQFPMAFFFSEGKPEIKNTFICRNPDWIPAPIRKVKIMTTAPQSLYVLSVDTIDRLIA